MECNFLTAFTSPFLHPSIHQSFLHPLVHPTLTAEGFIPPGSDVDPTVLAFVDVGFDSFTKNGFGSIQLTQVKDTILEVILKTYIVC